VTSLWAGRLGVHFPTGAGIFLFPHIQTGSGAHSPPTSSDMKNVWHYTSTSWCIFVCGA